MAGDEHFPELLIEMFETGTELLVEALPSVWDGSCNPNPNPIPNPNPNPNPNPSPNQVFDGLSAGLRDGSQKCGIGFQVRVSVRVKVRVRVRARD